MLIEMLVLTCYPVCQKIPAWMTPSPNWDAMVLLLDASEESQPCAPSLTPLHLPARLFHPDLHSVHQHSPTIIFENKKSTFSPHKSGSVSYPTIYIYILFFNKSCDWVNQTGPIPGWLKHLGACYYRKLINAGSCLKWTHG